MTAPVAEQPVSPPESQRFPELHAWMVRVLARLDREAKTRERTDREGAA